jgi:DNA-3-methyladenine glycosylase
MDKEFFERDARDVARDLLGKILVRKLKENGKEKKLRARIVETEAYYGREDPASRACKGGDLRKVMEMDASTILVYGVHNNWLINFVTDKKGEASAVLLRALEPLNFKANTKGPGLLTRALNIGKDFHCKDICDNEGLWLENDKIRIDIKEAKRIGVKKDLETPLRFYIKNNEYVSRK